MLDILIKNGTVIDGTGRPGQKLDVAIEKGKVVQIAANITNKAQQTINAQDRFVTPGFIDIQNHSDSYFTIFDQPDQLSLLSQGITTIIMGNCGASLAPLLSPESIKTIQKWHNLAGVNINWQSVAEFLDHMSKMKMGVNAGTLIGHATMRRGLLGDQIRQLNEGELKSIKKSLADGLSQGALGLSMGLIYAHEVDSSKEELQMLCDLLKPQNKYLSVHLRSEGSHVLESADEVIDMATKSGIALKISHMKIRDKKNWPLFERLMSKLEVAYHQGLNISFDMYPYDTSWSVLYTYLPRWAYEGGRSQILKMIADPTTRRKILDALRTSGQDLGQIIIAESSGNNNFVGKSLSQIAANQSVSNEEALLNILNATNAQVSVFDHNLSDEQVDLMMASPLSFIATDGAGYSDSHATLMHPRCFGAMPRFLRLVREKNLMKWEFAIKKLSSDPAKFLGLNDRGTLSVNNPADITIFNPQTVTDRTDYKNPAQFSDGIDVVIVNGKIAFANKQVVALNGQVVKR